MKKIIIIMIVIASFTGCDLERFPHASYSSSKILEDPEASLDILLNGNYSYLKSIYTTQIRFGEYRSENVRKNRPTTAGYWYFFTWERDPSMSLSNTFWNECYKIISQSSEIITLIKEGDSDEIDSKLGQAYYLRGLAYFNLVNMFGRPYYQSPETNLGVPIVNGVPAGGLVGHEFPNRATVTEVYRQITGDLRKAEAMCNPHSSNVRASKEVAQAALAKAYIYMSGTYEAPNPSFTDSADYYSDLVIEGGKFTLLSRDNFMKYNEFAPDEGTQTETIFAAKVHFEEVATAMPSQLGGMYSRIQNLGWEETAASSIAIDLLSETGTNDWRKGHGDYTGIVDARAAFIVPGYDLSQEGGTRAFVFVAEQKNAASGEVTGYGYQQFDVESVGTRDELLSVKDLAGEVYPVTLNGDLKNRRYDITYDGKTYTGYDDLRVSLTESYPKYQIYRCSLEEDQSQLHSPIIARLSDLILIRAEASAKKGDYAQALTDVNTIRRRAIVGGEYASLDATNAKELIMKERHLELMFHGDRSLDVFRLGESISRPMPGWIGDPFRTMLPTDLDVVMYIPNQQINAWTGTLTQNP